MREEKLQLRLHRNPARFGYEVFAFETDRLGRRFFGGPFDLYEHDGTSPVEPIAQLSEEAAQKLADDLWAAGIRPKGAEDTSTVTGAMQAHLDTLRDENYVRVPRELMRCRVRIIEEPET